MLLSSLDATTVDIALQSHRGGISGIISPMSHQRLEAILLIDHLIYRGISTCEE